MKNVMIAMALVAVSIVSLNVGVTWGISGKPVLDLDKCTHVIRYEDYSMECRTTVLTAEEGERHESK